MYSLPFTYFGIAETSYGSAHRMGPLGMLLGSSERSALVDGMELSSSEGSMLGADGLYEDGSF